MATDIQLGLEVKVAGFRALSDPIRLQILETLRHREICVCDLCDVLGVPQSKLSFHLRVLREADLIQGRQEGRWIYYSLHLPAFADLADYLTDYQNSQDPPTKKISSRC